jgi:hydrogenase nickel incorporation protein HypA/HybF
MSNPPDAVSRFKGSRVHEMSIVQTLLEQVQSEVEKSGQQGRVVSLHLVIGRLSGVHVDSIRLGFELLSPNSIADGATLCIDQPRARSHCDTCGAQPEIEEIVDHCPACGQADITIRGGQELLLQSIELED